KMLRYYESKSITQKYQKYRPHYPVQLAEDALGNFKEKKLDFLLDVGCGGGQSVNIFAPYFHEVLAIDPSENQIKEARSQNKFAHVTYKQGIAEKLPCDDVSVDVITVGTAIHWLDRPKFYEEVTRVLKPNGRLIIFGYWSPEIVPLCLLNGDDTKLSEIGTQLLKNTFNHLTEWNSVFHERHSHVRDKYNQIFGEIPFPNKRRFDNKFMKYIWSLVDMKGMIQSVDSYETYMKSKELELKELSEQFVRSLKESWGCTEMENSDVKMQVVFNFFVLVADKPN
uniref:Methyltransferase type 11 domain-containing protein n=1 Tax=Ciona intestinalis TaxID=7719 RepID=F7B757_CIOIN